MIRSYRSKALKKFAVDGDASKLPVANADRVRRCLDLLELATRPEETNLPSFDFHGLQGKPKRYAIKVTANYRLTFAWDNRDAIDLDLEDYH